MIYFSVGAEHENLLTSNEFSLDNQISSIFIYIVEEKRIPFSEKFIDTSTVSPPFSFFQEKIQHINIYICIYI